MPYKYLYMAYYTNAMLDRASTVSSFLYLQNCTSSEVFLWRYPSIDLSDLTPSSKISPLGQSQWRFHRGFILIKWYNTSANLFMWRCIYEERGEKSFMGMKLNPHGYLGDETWWNPRWERFVLMSGARADPLRHASSPFLSGAAVHAYVSE